MKNIVGERCTGCGACRNICPYNAIRMEEDTEGFLYPEIQKDKCVNCKKCESICPVLHPTYKNSNVPECYGMMAGDSKRLESSSGAFVPLAAEWVLQHEGVVYGAAYRSDWSVHHIRIDRIEELSKIKNAKYMQSDNELIYRDVKEQLQSGKQVLFTGTPCEIAGLYAALGDIKNTDKLITIDLICHGAPSYKVYRKYLDDNYDFSSITDINFRSKKVFGWDTTQNITLNDGKEIHINSKKDYYIKAFLACLMNRPSCSICPFSCLPRQGDITVGDFWGVKAHDEALDDGKGTSAVIINNEKGKEIVKIIEPEMKLWKEVPQDAITRINKTLIHPFNRHAGRKHFFSAMDLKPFNTLVNDSLEHNYDIGVVGLWYGINYGSILTYYALYLVLRELGYDTVMLPRPNSLWEGAASRFDDMQNIAQKFIWKYCNVFLKCRCQEEYARFNDRCDTFVVGSDVVWYYDICGKDTDQFFFLDWVEDGHKKIAYAASFGNGLEGPEEYKTKARYYLKQFDSVSVREAYGVEAAKSETGRNDIEHVLDPVFVCNPKVYDEIIRNSKLNINDKFIFTYVLNKQYSGKKKKILKYISQIENKELIFCPNPNGVEVHKFYEMALHHIPSVEDWLYYMKHCHFFLGDSYHGLCFALIFHKPFLIFSGEESSDYNKQRFLSLLKIVGLEERFLNNMDDLSAIHTLYEKQIDWEYVDRCIQENKDKSLKWLKNALEHDVKELNAEKLIRDSYVRKVSDRIADLDLKVHSQEYIIQQINNEISNKENEIENIKNSFSYKIGRSITWVPRKIRKTVKDTPKKEQTK